MDSTKFYRGVRYGAENKLLGFWKLGDDDYAWKNFWISFYGTIIVIKVFPFNIFKRFQELHTHPSNIHVSFLVSWALENGVEVYDGETWVCEDKIIRSATNTMIDLANLLYEKEKDYLNEEKARKEKERQEALNRRIKNVIECFKEDSELKEIINFEE